ncbi:ATPase, T2SS/T4P/T4SS family [Bdellovibrionota bacterium FG-2]
MNTPTWLATLLARPDITDLCLNGHTEVFADQGGGMLPSPFDSWSEPEMRTWVLQQISAAGKTWDAKNPFIDATLPTGHRIHVVFPPISPQGLIVSLRRLAKRNRQNATDNSHTQSAESRWGDSPLFQTLKEAVVRGDSVILSGPTGSGKTTLANDLLEGVPANERIIALEDTPELSPAHPHFLSLISRPPNADGFGEVTLRSLLKQALRMRPDRIVLGECRGAEVLDLLQILNTGHQGGLATLHANSPRDALRRIELLCLLASSGSLPQSVVREFLASGVQWVGQLQTDRKLGKRTLTELWRIEGREGDTILMRPMVQQKQGDITRHDFKLSHWQSHGQPYARANT